MDLPPWLTPLPDAAEQRTLDSWAIEQQRIPAETLMERAGSALARACAELVPEGRIVIACGHGNNGGDGHVAARVLQDMGREASVIDVGGDGVEFAGRLPSLGQPAWLTRCSAPASPASPANRSAMRSAR